MIANVGTVVIGGGMGFTFVKAMGGSIGTSLVEDDKLDLARELISKAKTYGCNLMIPEDTVITNEFKIPHRQGLSNRQNSKWLYGTRQWTR